LQHHRLLLVPWVVILAQPVGAQTSVDIGPLVGYYRPYGHFDPASVYDTRLPERPDELRGRAWGGAAHLSFGRRLGAEAQASVASSTIPSRITPAGLTRPWDARVLVVTAQAQYDVSPRPRSYHVWLGIGPALVRHGGDAYRSYGSSTSAGGALGVGITAPMGAHLRVAAVATTLLYQFDLKMPPELRLNPGSLEHGFQTDALVHIGIRWAPR
jgi:hypothetical protein